MKNWYAIILAGGTGTRMNAGQNKVFLPVGGVPAIARSVKAFLPFTDGIVVVRRPQEGAQLHTALHAAGLDPTSILFADAGETRQASVASGLSAVPASCTFVAVHDGARCLVTEEVIRRTFDSAERFGSGVASVALTDTVKVADGDGRVVSTPDRCSMRAIQTPQSFRTDLLRQAHAQAARDEFVGTDDASLLEHIGLEVRLTEGARSNIKLTTPEDLAYAEALLSPPCVPELRIGHGYDVHRLVPERKLILCGTEIPYEFGLLGHSDADAAIHALMDALLGALALGDIGKHFPDTDPQYAGISSLKLLEHVMALLRGRGASVINADVTISAQRPKLAPFIPQMRRNIAGAMGISEDRVSVKATTTEKLGFEGRGEGISAAAVCMLSLR